MSTIGSIKSTPFCVNRKGCLRLSKKSNRRKKVKKEKGFSLEEKLSTKLTDEGPRKRQKWQYHYICGTSCRPLIRHLLAQMPPSPPGGRLALIQLPIIVFDKLKYPFLREQKGVLLRLWNYKKERRKEENYLWKKAAAIAPGPACVPTTLPMAVTASSSAASCQRAALSAMYLRSMMSLRPV